jgi:hypothetical protein
MAKSKKIMYGIEITKPWSKEMYAHNDLVLEITKTNIQKALDDAYAPFKTEDTSEVESETESDEEGDLTPQSQIYVGEPMYNIAKAICGFGWIHMSAEDIYEEATKTLDTSSPWWINEMYPDLVEQGFVEVVEPWFVGF